MLAKAAHFLDRPKAQKKHMGSNLALSEIQTSGAQKDLKEMVSLWLLEASPMLGLWKREGGELNADTSEDIFLIVNDFKMHVRQTYDLAQ